MVNKALQLQRTIVNCDQVWFKIAVCL